MSPVAACHLSFADFVVGEVSWAALRHRRSESIVNQNCDCVNNGIDLATYTISYNTDFTEILQYGCGTNGTYVEKLEKR